MNKNVGAPRFPERKKWVELPVNKLGVVYTR